MKWPRSGIFLVVLLSVTLAVTSLRLPGTSVPVSYDLQLETALESGARDFSGSVKILIQIVQDTDILTLHNRQLTIQTVKVTDSLDNEVPIDDPTHEPENEFVHIKRTSETFTAGLSYTIEITFNGLLQLGTSGFYRSSYNADDGSLR